MRARCPLSVPALFMLYLYGRTEALLVMTKLDFTKIAGDLAARAAARNARLKPKKSFDEFFTADYLTGKQQCLSESLCDLSRTTRQYLKEADACKDIDYYFDLNDTGFKLLVKKLIRKANKFLFFRNMDRQRNFNKALLEANLILSKRIDTLQQQLDILQRQYTQELNAARGNPCKSGNRSGK